MKKTFLLLFILLIPFAAKAQGFYFGPTAGLNISTLTKQSYSKAFVRGNIGVQAGYQIDNIFSIHSEVLYSWQGAKYTNSGDKASFNYIKVPVLGRMFIVGGLNVEAGLSFNFLVNSRMRYNDLDGKEYDLNTTDLSHKFDLAVPVGVNYLFFDKYEIGVRYDISLIRVWKDSNNRSRNSNISINLRYRF